jgi:hypothetical protein
MSRLLALAAALGIFLVGGAQLAGGAGGKVTLRTFAGEWQGHDRFLTITSAGRGAETVLDSCCQRAVTVRFQISKVWGTIERPLASAAVTYVHVYDPSDFTKQHPAPHVGQVGTLRIAQGVLYEPMAGDTYCNAKTEAVGKCGA